jgi:hypothetical protein
VIECIYTTAQLNTDMGLRQQIVFTLIVSGIAFISAMSVQGLEASTESGTDAETPEALQEALPFTGSSVVIQFAGNLWNDTKLDIVDQYASNGYDIMAVIPFNDRFFFVLEAEP